MDSDPPRIRVGCLLYTDGGKLLLVRHQKNGRQYWLLPGGGVEPGEVMLVALARELREECGLEGIQIGEPVCLVESIAPSHSESRRHIVHVVFAARLPDPSIAHVHDGSIDGIRLVERDELSGLDLRPPINRFAERWQPGDPFVHLGSRWAS